MYNVTNDFHEAAFGNSREIAIKVVFNSTESNEGIEVDGDYIQDVTIEEVISADGLTIGSTCSNKATMNMYVPEEGIPLTNGWFNAFVGIPNECPLGKFYITEVITKDKYRTVAITAYDKMCQLGKQYTPSSSMTFPAKVAAVVADIALQNDFEVAETAFPDYEVDLIEATEREMIGYCAGLMGKNAKFNRDGKLVFVWFTDTDMDIPLEAQYQNGFTETTADSFVLGGLVSGTNENLLTAGEGRTITFSNPFMTQDILDGILSKVQGFSYTPCEVKYRCDPSFETGDIVDVVDDDEDVIAVHPTPIMAQTIKISGGLNSTIYAYGMSEENSTLMVSPSKIEIDRMKSSFEEYMSKLSENLTGSNGGYYHINYGEDGKPSGWTIMNTPVLTPTTKLWMMSSGGLMFSEDGGKTISKLAFDLEGNFYADCIKSGSISADKLDVEDLFTKDITATGDFALGNDGALSYDSKTGELSIKAKSLSIGLSEVATKSDIASIEVGGKNLIRNSNDMIFDEYYFYEPGESTPVAVTWDNRGNVTLYGATATHDDEGNVTVSMKTLTVNGTTFEVVDEKARKDIEDIQMNGLASSWIGTVTIYADKWVGRTSPYSQVVNIDGITENSQVNLTPSVEQLEVFREKDLAFVATNDGGVVTVYAVGQKPQNDYTIQITVIEVIYE